MPPNQLAFDAWLLECGIEAALFFAAMQVLCGLALTGVSARDRCFALLVGFLACLLLPLLSGAALSAAALERALPATGLAVLKALPAVWLTGFLLLLAQHTLRIVRMERQTRRLKRSLAPWEPDFYLRLAAENGLARPPLLLVDPSATSASIQGIWRPIIRVGPDFVALPITQQQQIVLHELQHFKRRDLLATVVARLVVAVYWPIPSAWRLASQLALDSERACDDAVLAAGYRPRDYAETLISAFERQPLSEPNGIYSLAVAPSRGQRATLSMNWGAWRADSTLHKRLISIISPRSRRAPSMLCRATSASVVLLTALACSGANPIARALPPTEPVTVRVAVQTTSDDAEENVSTGEVMVASRDLDFFYDKQQEMHPLVGVRFCGLNIPRGARLLSARIVFVGDELPAGMPRLSIMCQQDPNARTFLKRPFDISDRFSGGEPSVQWRPGADWCEISRTADSITPELRELVQDLIDHPEWNAGSCIVFGVASEKSSPQTYRESASFDHELGPEVAPVLEITYQDF
ncbi:Regulatory protein BlaR1 [Posidoniimonas corsicana]|uniref:Regulatory protein BlaR1 n=1 Tax=Posidoniimonas corsicana TaxID=1938618 RepID=A0A5C5V5V3_9BACT|nr:M56 family metallopeptidase [Posidoniimonas corsicana]TWT33944.1 Regulatory protein BlaR1 [Posidoniimonas corsicana]